MILTKYGHACFTVEKDGVQLVVDPGNFSTDYIPSNTVIAVVITHEHPDHFDHEQLEAIIDKNPDAVIIGNESITSKIDVFQTRTVTAGEHVTIGPFELDFTGGEHAVIHDSYPRATNVGVMINDLLYYPGDSFVVPNRPVDTLAITANAPWMKTSEAMNFLATINPRYAFPTHDSLLSDVGKSLTDRLLGSIAEKQGITYRRLDGPIEI